MDNESNDDSGSINLQPLQVAKLCLDFCFVAGLLLATANLCGFVAGSVVQLQGTSFNQGDSVDNGIQSLYYTLRGLLPDLGSCSNYFLASIVCRAGSAAIESRLSDH